MALVARGLSGIPLCVIDDIKLQQWNPMESDFLNRRNNYKIDDEDAQLALHGYSMFTRCLLLRPFLHPSPSNYAGSTSNRPCRFFDTREGCKRGSKCPFLHLLEGIIK